jgi:predicted regulator of Ras-like GTPase activity (Roadblock/LC7/MglB family)
MFKDVLREVVERTEGGIAGLVMGFDGIAIERYLRQGARIDMESIGMEYGVLLQQIGKAAQQLEAGAMQEVSVRAEHQTTVMRLLNDEYFVALTLAPEGNLGKGRFLLRTLTPKLLDELL